MQEAINRNNYLCHNLASLYISVTNNSNNSYIGFSIAKSELQVEIMVTHMVVQKWTPPNPIRLDLSRDLNHKACFA